MSFFNRLRNAMPKVPTPAGGGGGGGEGGALGGIAAVVVGAIAAGYGAYNSLYTVDGGHRAVVFSRLTGVKNQVIGEGTHFVVPWLERPYIFDIRTKPKQIRSPTGTKDLQTVDLTLRVLYKPIESALPRTFSELGRDYDERVLPSIVNETLKAVIAQFNASQLITQRQQVSELIRRSLTERAGDFNIAIDDVSITHLTFGKEYTAAVEAKQVAQQEAERAKYTVKQAMQDKQSTIVKAEGEAKSAELIGTAVAQNPGYIELRKLEAAQTIAETLARGNNQVYLDSGALLHSALFTNTTDIANIKPAVPQKK